MGAGSRHLPGTRLPPDRATAMVLPMPRRPRRPAALVEKIFVARSAHRRHLVTPGQLRSSAWQHVFRGVYADSRLRLTHKLRCAAAFRHVLPWDAAIAGRSAAHLHGALPPPDGEPVEVVVPRRSRFGPVVGLRIHNGELMPGDLRFVEGVTVTSPVRTCWDLALWLDPVEAVVLVDQLARARAVTVPQLASYARARAGSRGWRRLARVAQLADAGAESPQESRLRVRLVLVGIPRPVTQHEIRRDGELIARVDLAWPDRRVAVEYDGVWHAAEEQIHADRRRLNRVTGAGWTVLHVTGKRLREDFDGFVAELRAALRRPT
jgi:very-short-patch-repair endonuclease